MSWLVMSTSAKGQTSRKPMKKNSYEDQGWMIRELPTSYLAAAGRVFFGGNPVAMVYLWRSSNIPSANR
jgi:hypothetical protein